ncbi:MAG: hypothetical protein ABWZ82_06830 [Candidatus Limnocylindrales bacterium]
MSISLTGSGPTRTFLPVLPVSRLHLGRMAGSFGMFQHAHGRLPAPAHGYCTDDMARLVMVDLHQQGRDPSSGILDSIESSLLFLEEAFAPTSGRFRNFRAASGAWLDASGTDDSLGRAIQALGCVMRLAPERDQRQRAQRLLRGSLPAGAGVRAPRPMAYVILGCLDADAGGMAWALAAAEHLAQRLGAMIPHDPSHWPWPEDVVTYDNGVIPQALIAAGRRFGRDGLTTTGLRCLDWLMAAQLGAGHLRPVGNRGWWLKGGRPARFDQQPIEAASLLGAAATAFGVAADPRWLDMAGRCLAWFVGDNDLGAAIADPDDGSCRDGLGERDVNPNRGAESTLAWLLSVETAARLAASAAGPSGLVDLAVGRRGGARAADVVQDL